MWHKYGTGGWRQPQDGGFIEVLSKFIPDGAQLQFGCASHPGFFSIMVGSRDWRQPQSGGFMEVLSKFIPEEAQLQFGCSFVSWVLLDHGEVKGDLLSFTVLLNVSSLVFVTHPTGVAHRLLLDLEPLLHEVRKKTIMLLVFWKVPDFVNMYNGVSKFNCLDELNHAPCKTCSSGSVDEICP